jgi:hypothetical protein
VTSEDDETLRTAEDDPDSPKKLLRKLEHNTVTHLPVGKKASRPYVCADGDLWLHADSSYYKRSREEEEEKEKEELRRIWGPCRRAKRTRRVRSILVSARKTGLKLGDFSRGAIERFTLEIKTTGPLLDSPFAEDEGLCGSLAFHTPCPKIPTSSDVKPRLQREMDSK